MSYTDAGDEQGVVITSVRTGGPADLAHLQPGDIIFAAHNYRIRYADL